MSKQFLAILIIIGLGFIGIVSLSGNKNKAVTTSTAQPSAHTLGVSAKSVKLVEFADYECPYCEGVAPIIKQVQDEFKDRVVFQFSNFPLTSVHVNAFSAARATEAASLQGKFWEMHDALYDSINWKIWTVASDPTVQYNAYATQLGLNLAQFKADFVSSKVNDSINADMSAATKLNVQGTPTYFLNGAETKINPTLADFEKVLNAALAK